MLFVIFSENYIFGKFDTFCKRLEKIVDIINTMDAYSGLGEVRIEGIETIAVRYKSVVDATKKKSYDILDHRKGEVCTQIEAHQIFCAHLCKKVIHPTCTLSIVFTFCHQTGKVCMSLHARI